MNSTPRAMNVTKRIKMFNKGMSVKQIARAQKVSTITVYNSLTYHGVIKKASPLDKVAKQQKLLRARLRKAETIIRSLRKLI